MVRWATRDARAIVTPCSSLNKQAANGANRPGKIHLFPLIPLSPGESRLSHLILANPACPTQSLRIPLIPINPGESRFRRAARRRQPYSAAARAGAGTSMLKRRAQLSPTTFALVSSSTLASTRFRTSWL